MFNRNDKTRVLAMLLLIMMVATPLIGMSTRNTSNQGPATPLNQQSNAQRTQAASVIQKWTYAITTGEGEPSPALADLYGDGKLEALVAYGYNLDAVNSIGVYNNTYQVGADPSFDESPVVADINHTGKPWILCTSQGYIWCDNGTAADYGSSIIWRTSVGYITSSPAIGDIYNNGKLEVVAGDQSGYVFGYNGTTGQELWQYPGEGATIYSAPALADMNHDGKLEAIVLRANATGSFVQCLNCTPDLSGYVDQLWAYNVTGSVSVGIEHSSPTVADIDNDGHMEVIVGTMSNKTYCLSDKGALKWSYTTGGNIYSSPTVVDLNGDGKKETLIGSDDNNTYCLSSTGQLIWKYVTGGYLRSSPAVADVDGNKHLDVLVGSDDGYLYCLNATGGLEWRYQTGDKIESSPAIADIDGDHKLEIVVESDDGYAYCLSASPSPIVPGAYPWPSIGYRGDIHHSGCITDSDHDGLTDNYEITVGTNPHSVDTDGDTMTDYQEFLASTNPFVDTVPPASISNLVASNPTNTTVTLTWTAPGNNMMSGTATGYIVKYSTSGPITASNWGSATPYPQSWTPLSPGSAETHEVSGLSNATRYWFAVEAHDAVPNYGNVSNDALMSTLVTGWQSNPPISLIPGPGNNATMPSGSFQQYGFTMVTSNATDVTVISASSNPPGTGAPPSGELSFLYLDIKGTQTNGTSGLAIYIYYNRHLVPSGLNETSMQIHRWNATTSQWIAIPSTVTIINLTHGVITAHLNHLSYFAVLGTPSSGGNISTLLTAAGVAGVAIVVVALAIIVLRKRRVVPKVAKVRRTRHASGKHR
jgi:outer membrane protein assembly factor BamB